MRKDLEGEDEEDDGGFDDDFGSVSCQLDSNLSFENVAFGQHKSHHHHPPHHHHHDITKDTNDKDNLIYINGDDNITHDDLIISSTPCVKSGVGTHDGVGGAYGGGSDGGVVEGRLDLGGFLILLLFNYKK